MQLFVLFLSTTSELNFTVNTGSICSSSKNMPLMIRPASTLTLSYLFLLLADIDGRIFTPCKAPIVSFSKNLYPYCSVLDGSRNGFDRDLYSR